MKKILLAACVAVAAYQAQAQVKLAAVAAPPNNSAILELESGTKGFLPPRMTTLERAAIASPANGLIVYNTTLGCVEMYDGSRWACLTGNTDVPATGQPGGNFTTPHGSNTAAFSTNPNCTDKLISAGYTSCPASVTVGANTYPLVLINGQCWMQTNLKEFPSRYGGYTPGSWGNVEADDKGYWGYYHTTVGNGSAGWGTTEPAAGEGMLYQWSAAMNGSNRERAQGVCPTGYHVPSDCEWMYLEHGLGMNINDQVVWMNRTSGDVDQKLWAYPQYGATGPFNTSGFTGLPAGVRVSPSNPWDGQGFRARGQKVYFITSTMVNDLAYISRELNTNFAGPFRHSGMAKSWAISVRCLKD